MKFVIYLFAFATGAHIGSAALCFFDRRRRGDSWRKDHSRCAACGHELKMKDCIPVVSYLSLRGRCRYCHATYPIATILSEVSSGMAFVFATLSVFYGVKTGNTMTGIAEALIFVLLAFASANDICCHECELAIQFSIFGIGALYAFLFGTAANLLAACVVCAALTLFSFVYRKVTNSVDGMGLADIIVLTGISCVLSPLSVLLMMYFAAGLSFIALPVVRKNQKMQQISEEQESYGLLAFIPVCMFLALVLYRSLVD